MSAMSDSERIELQIARREARNSRQPPWPRFEQMVNLPDHLDKWVDGYNLLQERWDELQSLKIEREMANRREQHYLLNILVQQAQRRAAGRPELVGPYLSVIMRRCGVRLDLGLATPPKEAHNAPQPE